VTIAADSSLTFTGLPTPGQRCIAYVSGVAVQFLAS
jgi:hypothetical protein